MDDNIGKKEKKKSSYETFTSLQILYINKYLKHDMVYFLLSS